MDHPKFIARRAALLQELREKGIRDEQVLQAIGAIPRHRFVSSGLEDRAYVDTALPIAREQTISHPSTVARQTELLAVSAGDRVLEVGTGSGYQAAVLCQLGAKVYSVERHEELYFQAREKLRGLGFRPMLKHGDGTKGWSAFAPFDAIVVTAGAPVIPADLQEQLAMGGRLVIPVGDQQQQSMIRLVRIGQTEYRREEFSGFSFVPLVGEKGWGG